MKINIFLAAILTTLFCVAQSAGLPIGTLVITNDGVFSSRIESGNVARINIGFDGVTGYINFGTHTGNGYRDNILQMRGSNGYVG